MKKDYFRIKTKGEIDPKLVELLGASTKRNDSRTIGMFGSGAKYSVIEALRLGIEIYISTSKWFLTFELKDETVGNQTFKRVIYVFKDKEKRKKKLPTSFTTDAGKNWDKVWYILREWIANALDIKIETGEDFDMDIVSGHDYSDEGFTDVYIECTPGVLEIIKGLDRYMKTPDIVPMHTNRWGSIYPKTGPGARVFHKGMLVYESEVKEAEFDYSCDDVYISEDRTASYWSVEKQVVLLLSAAPVEIKKRILLKLDQDKDSFESRLDWASAVERDEWGRAFNELHPNGVLVNESDFIQQEIKAYGHKPVTLGGNESMRHMLKDAVEHKVRTFRHVLGPDSDKIKVIDNEKVPQMYLDRVYNAQTILDRHFPGYKDKKIVVFEMRDGQDVVMGQMITPDKIGINIRVLESGLDSTVDTLLHEYFHIRSGSSDYTRAFVNHIVNFCASLIVNRRVEEIMT